LPHRRHTADLAELGRSSVYGPALGVLDDDPAVKPQANIFVAEKAPWFDITDALPRFSGFPK
jgi:hypothetical protein